MTSYHNTLINELKTMAEQDGEIITRLRKLQRQRRDGEIDAATFDTAYAALNAEVDTLCACGRAAAVVRMRGQPSRCGWCVLEGTR
jgi:predicted membrane chloride channel (bestrophin family)